MERRFKAGRVLLEPFNINNQRFYIYIGAMMAGFLDVARDKALFPDGPVVEIHWRAIKGLTAEDLEHLKAGIDWLRRRS